MLKVLFVIVFVPVHSFATWYLVQWYLHNPPALGAPWAALSKGAAIALTLPVLFPLMNMDPDGDRFPKWFQVLSVPLNSLVWALAALGAAAIMRQLLARRGYP